MREARAAWGLPARIAAQEMNGDSRHHTCGRPFVKEAGATGVSLEISDKALNGPASLADLCPHLGEERKTYARTEVFAFLTQTGNRCN